MDEDIQVRDMFLAAFLILHDFRPKSISIVGRIAYGCYTNTPDIQRLLEIWRSPSNQVPASRYAGAYREAKRVFLDGMKP